MKMGFLKSPYLNKMMSIISKGKQFPDLPIQAHLIAQMEFSRFEHETDMLREELRKKEAVRDQHKSMWSVKEKYMEDIMKQEQERQKALEDGIFSRMQSKPDKEEAQEVDLTTEHENNSLEKKDEIKEESQNDSLITQAQNLSSILDLQNCLSGLGQTANLSDLETLNTLLICNKLCKHPL